MTPRRVYSRLRILCQTWSFPVAVFLLCILFLVRYTTVNQKYRQLYDNRTRNIVWYMLYHGGLRNEARNVDMNHCEYKNCRISFIDNQQQRSEYLSQADAVIFQASRLPSIPPGRTHTGQKFVFASSESPIHLRMGTKVDKKSWRNQIDWTMTYRMDSDIPYKYGAVTPKQEFHEDTSRNYSEIFHKKTKEIAWLVSDCRTESFRGVYVKKLQKYINVDIYGKCGPFKNCTKEEMHRCKHDIARDYKFYLSFENSMCIDYMTEKVYTWFDEDIINIVRGAQTYSEMLPAGSYIHTERFPTIQRLANYLLTLTKDEMRYTQYLRKKSKYVTEDHPSQYQNAYCDLCKRLHTQDTKTSKYEDVHTWWYNGACKRYVTDLN